MNTLISCCTLYSRNLKCFIMNNIYSIADAEQVTKLRDLYNFKIRSMARHNRNTTDTGYGMWYYLLLEFVCISSCKYTCGGIIYLNRTCGRLRLHSTCKIYAIV